MAYISLILDFRAYKSIVSICIIIYSGFNRNLRFDFDLICPGKITGRYTKACRPFRLVYSSLSCVINDKFQEHMKDKYGAGNEDAVHHYEITQTSGPTSSRDYSHMVECNSDETNPSIISNRDYEQRKQDEYRQIRLLDRRYLDAFVDEFENLVKV